MNKYRIETPLLFTSTKVHKKYQKNTFFFVFLLSVILIPFFNISQIIDFQILAKKLQKQAKNNSKKMFVVLKKCITLQRFN